MEPLVVCADVSKLGKNEIDSENVNWLQSFLHIGNQSNNFCTPRFRPLFSIAGLPNMAPHSEPLLNGHGPYECLRLEQRKKMLASFAALVRYLPVE